MSQTHIIPSALGCNTLFLRNLRLFGALANGTWFTLLDGTIWQKTDFNTAKCPPADTGRYFDIYTPVQYHGDTAPPTEATCTEYSI